jgi:hypothetical protein
MLTLVVEINNESAGGLSSTSSFSSEERLKIGIPKFFSVLISYLLGMYKRRSNPD